MHLLGIDIGGTFTDCVILDSDRQVSTFKASSTPPDFADGVLAVLELATNSLEVPVSELLSGTDTYLAHGTTVATNIVVTRSGERVGLITTRGTGDNYEMGRGLRGSERDIAVAKHPDPLVPRHDVEEVTERVDVNGDVIAPLNEQDLRRAVRSLVAKGIGSIAVCFLWSFLRPDHEHRVEEIVREESSDVYVSLSSRLSGLLGEYERTSTTVLNSYVGPPTRRYLERLRAGLKDRQMEKELLVMRSDGGLTSIDGAVESPVHLLFSGPAAGVVGSASLASRLGSDDIVTFDMGGTSTDVAVVIGGEPQTATDQKIDRHPIQVPMIDIHSVGAGGGSIAWVGPGGTLRVGPDSAGADPGPACYGRGGDRATVTDADVVLGYIDPQTFAAGRKMLYPDLAAEAVDRFASEFEMSRTEAAAGIVEVVNHVMGDAIRVRTVANGADPRDFDLLAFGGAGGIHATGVAAKLGMRRVIVPRNASTFSAQGLLESDLIHTFSVTRRLLLNADLDAAAQVAADAGQVIQELDRQARDAFTGVWGSGNVGVVTVHAVEMCYQGQVLNLDVAVSAHEFDTEAGLRGVVERFNRRYEEVYGPASAMPHHGYEIRNFRTVATRELGGFEARPVGRPDWPTRTEPREKRQAYSPVARDLVEMPVFTGDELAPGAEVSGPAIIAYPDTAILIHERDSLSIDPYLNAIIDIGA